MKSLFIYLNTLAPGTLRNSDSLGFVVNLIAHRENFFNFSSDSDPEYKQDNLWHVGNVLILE